MCWFLHIPTWIDPSGTRVCLIAAYWSCSSTQLLALWIRVTLDCAGIARLQTYLRSVLAISAAMIELLELQLLIPTLYVTT